MKKRRCYHEIVLVLLAIVGASYAGSVPVQSEHIVEVGEEIDWGIGGAWARLFIQEPVDVFFYAAGGEFWKMDFLEDYELLEQQKVPLSGRTNLDDHAIRQCPDGSYLHAASGKIEETNDSGYMMMYDASWARINNHVLGEKSSEIAYNDMPLICHEKGRFVSFIDYNVWGSLLYKLDETGKPVQEYRIPEIGLSEGGTFLEDPTSGDLALVTSNHDNSALEVNFLDWDLNFLSTKTLFEIDPMVDRVYWPQAVEVIGTRIVVAYVNQPKKAGRISDWGDMWLAIFDLEWNLIESHAIVTEQEEDGCMRPGLAFKDDMLFYTYDEIVNHPPGDVGPRLVPIELNLRAFGLGEPDDTGSPPDSGDTESTDGGNGEEDSGDASETDDSAASCGCATPSSGTSSGFAWMVLALVGYVRRLR